MVQIREDFEFCPDTHRLGESDITCNQTDTVYCQSQCPESCRLQSYTVLQEHNDGLGHRQHSQPDFEDRVICSKFNELFNTNLSLTECAKNIINPYDATDLSEVSQLAWLFWRWYWRGVLRIELRYDGRETAVVREEIVFTFETL